MESVHIASNLFVITWKLATWRLHSSWTDPNASSFSNFVRHKYNLTCFRYHSHPGFGCWLSGVDINTQQSFEALSDRAVAVVVDPIQSVKGKVCNVWLPCSIFEFLWKYCYSRLSMSSFVASAHWHLTELSLWASAWAGLWFFIRIHTSLFRLSSMPSEPSIRKLWLSTKSRGKLPAILDIFKSPAFKHWFMVWTDITTLFLSPTKLMISNRRFVFKTYLYNCVTYRCYWT